MHTNQHRSGDRSFNFKVNCLPLRHPHDYSRVLKGAEIYAQKYAGRSQAQKLKGRKKFGSGSREWHPSGRPQRTYNLLLFMPETENVSSNLSRILIWGPINRPEKARKLRLLF